MKKSIGLMEHRTDLSRLLLTGTLKRMVGRDVLVMVKVKTIWEREGMVNTRQKKREVKYSTYR